MRDGPKERHAPSIPPAHPTSTRTNAYFSKTPRCLNSSVIGVLSTSPSTGWRQRNRCDYAEWSRFADHALRRLRRGLEPPDQQARRGRDGSANHELQMRWVVLRVRRQGDPAIGG